MRALISILTHRVDSGVRDCITSVLGGGGNYGLHLTANGCPEAAEIFRSVKDVAEVTHSIPVNVVVNLENEGFIPPNNRACAFAVDEEYDVLVLLNDDAKVPSGWLDAIEREFARHPAAALVGPTGMCRSLNENFHGFNGDRLEYIEGSCLAIRLSVIRKHFKTMFQPWLTFAYGEDSTLALEVRRRGYSIHQAGFTIEHNRGSTSKHVPKAMASQLRNHTLAIERYAHYLRHRTFQHRIVVRRWYSAGDVLLTTPVIRRLWEENPLCAIVVETNWPQLFDNNPCVALAAKDVMRRNDDLVIDLDMASENGPMRHFITSYARAAGVDDPPHKTEFWAAHSLRDFASERWCAIHTTTTWPGKNWPIDRFEEVSRLIRADGCKVMIVGSDPATPAITCDLDLRGKTTVKELAKHLASCALFVGVDSFPMHLAGAMGTPVVGIFGVTSSRFILSGRGPQVGIDANESDCPRAGERHRTAGAIFIDEDGTAIRTISVDRVMEGINNLMVELAQL